MNKEQRLTERQEKQRMTMSITLLIVGFLLQITGLDFHNSVLQALGVTGYTAAIVFPLTQRVPWPWGKKRVTLTIVTSLLAGCILFTLGLSYHNYILDGLSLVAYSVPYLAPVVLVRIREKRKTAQEKEQQTTM